MATASGVCKPQPISKGIEDYLDVAVDTFETRPGRRVEVGHHHHRGLAYWHVRTPWCRRRGRLTSSGFIGSLLKLRHDLERRGLL